MAVQGCRSIPEPGKLIDGQYISVVTARIYPAYCEAQIDTVKGYNELGSYVELPTAFRQYEIPDSLERFTVLDEFVYISETAEADDADTICSEQLKAAVADALDDVSGTIARRVSLASVVVTDDAGAVIAADVLCPVMSLSVGNAVCFSFRMQDNYSAGNQSAKGGKQYRMTQAVPYGDKYYGTAERLKFSLYASAMSTGVIAGAHAFPATDSASIALGEAMASTGAKPLKWYKDSAEVGNVSYQLHAMTRDGFIIGDMMMAHCSAVRAVDETESPVLYYYAEELNPLSGTNGTETVLERLTAWEPFRCGRLAHCVRDRGTAGRIQIVGNQTRRRLPDRQEFRYCAKEYLLKLQEEDPQMIIYANADGAVQSSPSSFRADLEEFRCRSLRRTMQAGHARSRSLLRPC